MDLLPQLLWYPIGCALLVWALPKLGPRHLRQLQPVPSRDTRRGLLWSRAKVCECGRRHTVVILITLMPQPARNPASCAYKYNIYTLSSSIHTPHKRRTTSSICEYSAHVGLSRRRHQLCAQQSQSFWRRMLECSSPAVGRDKRLRGRYTYPLPGLPNKQVLLYHSTTMLHYPTGVVPNTKHNVEKRGKKTWRFRESRCLLRIVPIKSLENIKENRRHDSWKKTWRIYNNLTYRQFAYIP